MSPVSVSCLLILPDFLFCAPLLLWLCMAHTSARILSFVYRLWLHVDTPLAHCERAALGLTLKSSAWLQCSGNSHERRGQYLQDNSHFWVKARINLKIEFRKGEFLVKKYCGGTLLISLLFIPTPLSQGFFLKWLTNRYNGMEPVVFPPAHTLGALVTVIGGIS